MGWFNPYQLPRLRLKERIPMIVEMEASYGIGMVGTLMLLRLIPMLENLGSIY